MMNIIFLIPKLVSSFELRYVIMNDELGGNGEKEDKVCFELLFWHLCQRNEKGE
jgi:hypothetical protein